MALGRTYTGCPVVASVPRTTASAGRRATTQAPQPPPPPPSSDALDHLLHCGLGMQAAARLLSLESEPGGRLAYTAMSAAAVIAVTALPNMAEDVQQAPQKGCAGPQLSHPQMVSKRLFEVVRDTRRKLSRPVSAPLLELAEVTNVATHHFDCSVTHAMPSASWCKRAA